MKKLLLLIVITSLVSCGIAGYTIKYDLSLDKAGQNKQLENVSTESFKSQMYSDSVMSIKFSYKTDERINFELTNRLDRTIKIIWDEVVFVDADGKSSRVMHDGIRYIDRNKSLPVTAIPSGATINEMVLPTSNVQYGGLKGWLEYSYLPKHSNNKNTIDGLGKLYTGKTIKIVLPIVYDDKTHDYTFVFKINGYQFNS